MCKEVNKIYSRRKSDIIKRRFIIAMDVALAVLPTVALIYYYVSK